VKKRTSVLTRLGIGAVTVATFGMGIPVLTAAPAAAAITTEQLSIVPVNAANNTQDNACQEYRVTAGNQQWHQGGNEVYDADNPYAGQTVKVILTPSAGINSQFCDEGDGGPIAVGDQGAGQPDQYAFTLDSSNDFNQDYFEFGINEKNTPNVNGDVVVGTIGVQAYVDQNGNNQAGSGEPQTAATDNILAGTPGLPDTNALSPQQDALADTVKAEPLAQNASSDQYDYSWFKVTVLHGSQTLQGADVNFQVTSKQGRVVDDSNNNPNTDSCINGPDFEDNDGLNQNPDNAGDIGAYPDGAYFNQGNQGPDDQDETDGAGVLYCYVVRRARSTRATATSRAITRR
jgi:hypothetical protein